MFHAEPKTLIVVYKDEMLVNQIKKMVETKDDKGEDVIVGTTDGSVRIVSWTESVWLDSKVLFIGDIKGTDKLVPIIDVKFNEYGVKYGWAGNQAVVSIDTKAIKKKEDYDAFLEKLRALQVPEAVKGSKTTQDIPVKSVTLGAAAFFGWLAFLGAGAAMLAKDFFTDKAMTKRQMLFYGLVNLYNKHLEVFMHS
jgi:hypothetical protein